MQVANCTTPANYFHVLRRQLKRDFRKPLILMTPKSLLRHPKCKSPLSEFGPDSVFQRWYHDDAERMPGGAVKLAKDGKIRRVILCSGKVYFDLIEDREKRGVDDVYVMRIEQLYPFPLKSVAQELSRFKNADLVWCQEEPQNMGSWSYIAPYLEWVAGQANLKSKRARYVGRPAAAATATGLMSRHKAELEAFLSEAFGG